MNPKVIGAIVAVIILLSISAVIMTGNRSKKQTVATHKSKKTRAPTPPTPAPTTAPPVTTAPPSTSTSVVYTDYAAGIIAPMPTPSFIMIPGANFPGLTGRLRDEASTYIITRYPRLVVRAVPLGTQLTYDVRSDRVTLAYDPYTNRIVNARIG